MCIRDRSHGRHRDVLGGNVGELGNDARENLGHAGHLHEGMDHEPLLAEAFLLVVGVFSRRIDLAQRQLAVAKQTADEALLHHHRLHAVDVDALEAVLQQAVLDFDAVVAATCAEAAVRDASADGRQQPQHERRLSLIHIWESIEKARATGLDVVEGDFAENVTTEGIDLLALPLGTRVRIGEDVDVYKRQAPEWLMSRSYHSATLSKATCALLLSLIHI